jgi:hypothetical protein
MNYNAVVDDLGSLGDSIASVVADSAREVVPAPSFHCFVHRCSYPRHSNHRPLSLPLTCEMGSILDETDGFFSKIILVDFVRRPRQRERKRNGQGRRSQASQRATAHVCLYDSLVRVLRLWFRFASLKLNLLVLFLEGCQLPSLLAPHTIWNQRTPSSF